MLLGLLTGKTEEEMAMELTNKYATGAFEARRLVRTESNFISGQMQRQAYEECDAEQYDFIAVLDLKTSKVCRELDGQTFYTKDMQPGVNCNPMHPFCRSTTAIHLDEDVLAGLQRRARNPVTGKNEMVPANMNYREWYRQNVEGKNTKGTGANSKQTGGKAYAPYDENNKRDIAASKFYKKISKRYDVDIIAQNSGFSVEDIKQIKRHIFFKKHKTYQGYTTLYPDYDMAVAWNRIYQGEAKERDILLLHHELLESQLEKKYNLTIAEAHAKATSKYDWVSKLIEEVGEDGEPYGLL